MARQVDSITTTLVTERPLRGDLEARFQRITVLAGPFVFNVQGRDGGMNTGLQCRAARNDFRSDGITIVFLEYKPDGRRFVAKPLVMEEVADHMLVPYESRRNLGATEAQKLIDDLWDCGIRPSEGQGSAGQLASIQEHLKDMRKLVTKFAEVDL